MGYNRKGFAKALTDSPLGNPLMSSVDNPI